MAAFPLEDSMISALMVSVLLITTPPAPPAPKDEGPAIKAAVLDYIEGWYDGDAARMERSLHPELAKRLVKTDAQGTSTLDQMSALTLVQATRKGWGKSTPTQRRQKDVTVLDAYEGAATVKLVAADWIDYLHLARWNGEWKIVNVLWELKPAAK
jgi:hypothetical protein